MDKNIDEIIRTWCRKALKHSSGSFGYMYPGHEESYYVYSNLSSEEIVERKDWHFSSEVND